MHFDKILNSVIDDPGSGIFLTPPYYLNGFSYFFYDPYETITAVNKEQLFSLLSRIDRISPEQTAFGFLTYEAGYAFEKKLNKFLSENDQLAYFSFYNQENVKKIHSSQINIGFDLQDDFNISSFQLDTSFIDYQKGVDKIKCFISEGDTYQVNYTIKGRFNFKGNPAALFKKIVFNQSAKYTAFLNTGKNLIISVSPELFFKVKEGKITAKPMKGTSSRGLNCEDDKYQRLFLLDSEKDKAENLMIVDLLRNDLGKISRFGSVKLNSLFDIEKYETLFQMTSEIEGDLNDEIKFSDIIKNIYPGGSVTGAPKIRTMEIIRELEKEKRGIYTGCIGYVKQNETKFNVAIRTIVLDQKEASGELGIGSGIVWDSNPQNEYRELQMKSKFFTDQVESFELFETIKVENSVIPFLNEHLNRLKNAADFFLFVFNEEKLRCSILKKIMELDPRRKYKLKFLLDKYGKGKIELSDYPSLPDHINVILSGEKINSGDPFRYFKTSFRKLYDEEYSIYSAQGFFDVIFRNERGQITEGSITNIFIKKNNRWYTPPVDSGILNGIYRAFLLETDKGIIEENLSEEDLIEAEEIKLTNALRGEMKVNKLYLNRFKIKEF